MSMHEKSGGILETTVTWVDLERNLRSALKTEASLGANKTAVDIGDGIGYASKCAMITCDWVGAEEEEKLPARVVVKIPSALPFRKRNEAAPEGQRLLTSDEAMWEKMEGILREIHDMEVATYNFFETFDGLSMPKMYYGSMFGKEKAADGQICLEFMENSRMMNFHEKHTVEQVRQIARALGVIQACSVKKEPTTPELLRNFFEDFGKTISKESYCMMFKALSGLDSSESATKLSEDIDKILSEYYGSTLPSTIHNQMGFRPVLVHGDCRTENVLIDKDTGDLATILDWQCTHLGVGVEDLLRISFFSLTTADRRASWAMLLAEMYNSLVENLDGAEPPYTLEMLQELSDILFPHCALYFAGRSIMLALNNIKDPSMAAEEKEKRRAIMADKIVGSLEDTLKLDAKNKSSGRVLKF